MNKPTFYITTPLYYPSGKWHLGHSYTTVCCDALARYKRMSGFDVFYLTGTDEHGQKIAESAAALNQTPQQFVDGLVSDIKKLWQLLDISYDGFIRTTDDYHVQSVQKIFKALYDKGDIYKGTYKGKYCTPCEAFFTDSQLVDGCCPDCGRQVIQSEEECYFFKLSKYKDKIESLLKTDFLQPSSRANEMINNFIKPGLSDLAVSRTSVKWGIPVSFDTKHVVYVWIDALSNYINALGYNTDQKNFKYWPCNLHMVGKEIVRFHAIIWPALLMALDLPLPKHVFGHGWLLFGGDKMSKSKGNVCDPFMLADRYGIDSLRYYLLKEIPFGQDGVYTDEAFLTRINADLVNDLGNLVKRTVAMANQYFAGKVIMPTKQDDCSKEFVKKLDSLKQKTDSAIESFSCYKALDEIFNIVKAANKYIDESTPWILFKQNQNQKLNAVLYNLLEGIRILATLLSPFITKGTKDIFDMLGIKPAKDFDLIAFGTISNYSVNQDRVLYQRLDIKKELDFLKQASGDNVKIKIDNNQKNTKKEQNDMDNNLNNENLITIDEFFKTELKIAKITNAERVEKADKLLKLNVLVGEEERIVVSGIAKSYSPEQLIGKNVVLVANLKPAKIRGIESFGMLLCACDKDKIVLITPESDIESGSSVG